MISNAPVSMWSLLFKKSLPLYFHCKQPWAVLSGILYGLFRWSISQSLGTETLPVLERHSAVYNNKKINPQKQCFCYNRALEISKQGCPEGFSSF